MREKMKSDKDIILNNIRESLSDTRKELPDRTSLDDEIIEKLKAVTPSTQNELIHQFKKELKKVNAEFIRINNGNEIIETLKNLLSNGGVNKIAIADDLEISTITESLSNVETVNAAKYDHHERKMMVSQIGTALVFGGNGIADTGSIVFFYNDSKTTYPHFLCDWTIVLIRENSIVANQFELIKNIDIEKAKNMVFVTGPSRTADIEKTLVLGAHGPRRVTVVAIP